MVNVGVIGLGVMGATLLEACVSITDTHVAAADRIATQFILIVEAEMCRVESGRVRQVSHLC